MPDKIKCTVSNCSYWESQLCKASAIEVNVDGGGNSAPDPQKTQCHTFQEK
ncbi:DUF1540 domain-containing protein [Metallumcola ferriviriculae]|uniref:DUF1540 domain-containing protein n=1 Tax=Metallumcola ferriviriculae TaxID=3039180 RepID=A0AAU0UQQ4_9FIRM|nr:DUF1540 domain-containing protein [Desulfitibacteraceae bacterium MK1]